MKIDLISGSHAVGEANYHLQFTPAYRKGIFADDAVRILTRDYLLASAKKHGITISAMGFGPDHCHVFTAECKNFSVSKIANLLKGFSSRMMRKNHWDLFRKDLYGDKFWSGGYFYRTVGAVNSETVKHYVEQSQQKHWHKTLSTKPNFGAQSKLIQFAA
ncbi:MAG: IS200/IS605 family transposase [Nanoarchaeota archaeon]|nr:IS200/IS605 family transposase [Nanoarchaeota archaeon]MCG2723771.1 IS200/IS605 family transposase [archaeon]